MTKDKLKRLSRLLFLIDIQQSGNKTEVAERNKLNALATQEEFDEAMDMAEMYSMKGPEQ